MIEIRVRNHVAVAEKRHLLARLLPQSLLRRRVEESIAERIRKTLESEGVDATVVLTDGQSGSA